MILKCIFLLVLSFGCCPAKELPSDIPKCKVRDVECIAKVATNLIKTSGNGRKDMGIPPYEPFKVDNLVLQEATQDQPVNLQLVLKDVVIHGMSGIIVERAVGFEKDPRTSKFEIYARAPKLDIKGFYKSNGRILVIPVNGEGKFNMTAENVKISLKFKPTVFEKDGKQYLDVQKVKILIEPEIAKAHLDRFLRDGNPLGDRFNEFLNDNWREFWQEIYPTISEAMLNIARGIISEPLRTYSYDDIYLPD